MVVLLLMRNVLPVAGSGSMEGFAQAGTKSVLSIPVKVCSPLIVSTEESSHWSCRVTETLHWA
jgi:hypothetical protein